MAVAKVFEDGFGRRPFLRALEGGCANLGHVEDDESNLIYMRARYYDPTSGRFLSEDPEMQGQNWFSYCSSDPISLCDESGKSADDIESIMKELLGKGEISKEFYNMFMDRSTGLRESIHKSIRRMKFRGRGGMPREELKEFLKDLDEQGIASDYQSGVDPELDCLIVEVEIGDESGVDGLL